MDSPSPPVLAGAPCAPPEEQPSTQHSTISVDSESHQFSAPHSPVSTSSPLHLGVVSRFPDLSCAADLESKYSLSSDGSSRSASPQQQSQMYHHQLHTTQTPPSHPSSRSSSCSPPSPSSVVVVGEFPLQATGAFHTVLELSTSPSNSQQIIEQHQTDSSSSSQSPQNQHLTLTSAPSPDLSSSAASLSVSDSSPPRSPLVDATQSRHEDQSSSSPVYQASLSSPPSPGIGLNSQLASLQIQRVTVDDASCDEEAQQPSPNNTPLSSPTAYSVEFAHSRVSSPLSNTVVAPPSRSVLVVGDVPSPPSCSMGSSAQPHPQLNPDTKSTLISQPPLPLDQSAHTLSLTQATVLPVSRVPSFTVGLTPGQLPPAWPNVECHTERFSSPRSNQQPHPLDDGEPRINYDPYGLLQVSNIADYLHASSPDALTAAEQLAATEFRAPTPPIEIPISTNELFQSHHQVEERKEHKKSSPISRFYPADENELLIGDVDRLRGSRAMQKIDSHQVRVFSPSSLHQPLYNDDWITEKPCVSSKPSRSYLSSPSSLPRSSDSIVWQNVDGAYLPYEAYQLCPPPIPTEFTTNKQKKQWIKEWKAQQASINAAFPIVDATPLDKTQQRVAFRSLGEHKQFQLFPNDSPPAPGSLPDTLPVEFLPLTSSSAIPRSGARSTYSIRMSDREGVKLNDRNAIDTSAQVVWDTWTHKYKQKYASMQHNAADRRDPQFAYKQADGSVLLKSIAPAHAPPRPSVGPSMPLKVNSTVEHRAMHLNDWNVRDAALPVADPYHVKSSSVVSRVKGSSSLSAARRRVEREMMVWEDVNAIGKLRPTPAKRYVPTHHPLLKPPPPPPTVYVHSDRRSIPVPLTSFYPLHIWSAYSSNPRESYEIHLNNIRRERSAMKENDMNAINGVRYVPPESEFDANKRVKRILRRERNAMSLNDINMNSDPALFAHRYPNFKPNTAHRTYSFYPYIFGHLTNLHHPPSAYKHWLTSTFSVYSHLYVGRHGESFTKRRRRKYRMDVLIMMKQAEQYDQIKKQLNRMTHSKLKKHDNLTRLLQSDGNNSHPARAFIPRFHEADSDPKTGVQLGAAAPSHSYAHAAYPFRYELKHPFTFNAVTRDHLTFTPLSLHDILSYPNKPFHKTHRFVRRYMSDKEKRMKHAQHVRDMELAAANAPLKRHIHFKPLSQSKRDAENQEKACRETQQRLFPWYFTTPANSNTLANISSSIFGGHAFANTQLLQNCFQMRQDQPSTALFNPCAPYVGPPSVFDMSPSSRGATSTSTTSLNIHNPFTSNDQVEQLNKFHEHLSQIDKSKQEDLNLLKKLKQQQSKPTRAPIKPAHPFAASSDYNSASTSTRPQPQVNSSGTYQDTQPSFSFDSTSAAYNRWRSHNRHQSPSLQFNEFERNYGQNFHPLGADQQWDVDQLNHHNRKHALEDNQYRSGDDFEIGVRAHSNSPFSSTYSTSTSTRIPSRSPVRSSTGRARSRPRAASPGKPLFSLDAQGHLSHVKQQHAAANHQYKGNYKFTSSSVFNPFHSATSSSSLSSSAAFYKPTSAPPTLPLAHSFHSAFNPTSFDSYIDTYSTSNPFASAFHPFDSFNSRSLSPSRSPSRTYAPPSFQTGYSLNGLPSFTPFSAQFPSQHTSAHSFPVQHHGTHKRIKAEKSDRGTKRVQQSNDWQQLEWDARERERGQTRPLRSFLDSPAVSYDDVAAPVFGGVPPPVSQYGHVNVNIHTAPHHSRQHQQSRSINRNPSRATHHHQQPYDQDSMTEEDVEHDYDEEKYLAHDQGDYHDSQTHASATHRASAPRSSANAARHSSARSSSRDISHPPAHKTSQHPSHKSTPKHVAPVVAPAAAPVATSARSAALPGDAASSHSSKRSSRSSIASIPRLSHDASQGPPLLADHTNSNQLDDGHMHSSRASTPAAHASLPVSLPVDPIKDEQPQEQLDSDILRHFKDEQLKREAAVAAQQSQSEYDASHATSQPLPVPAPVSHHSSRRSSRRSTFNHSDSSSLLPLSSYDASIEPVPVISGDLKLTPKPLTPKQSLFGRIEGLEHNEVLVAAAAPRPVLSSSSSHASIKSHRSQHQSLSASTSTTSLHGNKSPLAFHSSRSNSSTPSPHRRSTAK